MVVGSICTLACGFYISLKFKLNLTTHKVLIEEINNIKGIGKNQERKVSESGKPIVEMLTGLSVNALWGNNNIGYKEK